MSIIQLAIQALVAVISSLAHFERVKADVQRVNEDMAGLSGGQKRQKVVDNANVFFSPEEHPGNFIVNLLIELAIGFLRHN
jgi:hypothetical protein